MRFSRRRQAPRAGEPRAYVGRHQRRRRAGLTSPAGPVAVIVLGMVGIAVLIVLNSAPPSSRSTEPPPTAPPLATSPRSTAPPPSTTPPRRSASTLFSVPTFQVGVRGWTPLRGTIFTRGLVGRQGVSFARIQQDPINQPVRDPSSGVPLIGIRARVLPQAERGMQVQTTVRLRATTPGVTVVVRLSEWAGRRQVDSGERGEGRLTLPVTGWHRLGADHHVAASGDSVYLEILALGLGPDGAFFVDHPTVTSP
jgi:hypothetical protein